eukprot:1322780-Ditylum_brightwellii.AAC.1
MEEPLVPIVFITIKPHKANLIMLRALLDSSAGASLIAEKYCNKQKTTHRKACFMTVAGMYGMIIGRDLLKSLGIILDHAAEKITWNDASIPMKTMLAQPAKSFHIKDPPGIDDM